MSIFNKLRQKIVWEFKNIIEWTEDTSNTKTWSLRCYQKNIQNDQFTRRTENLVEWERKGLFTHVNHSKQYKLTYSNILSTSANIAWRNTQNSLFNMDIYFVNTKEFFNLRSSITKSNRMDNLEFGAIHMRVFGSYSFQEDHDPIVFIRNIANTDGTFITESILDQLCEFKVGKFADYLIKSKTDPLNITENLNEFSSELLIILKNVLCIYGIELSRILVGKISLPEVVEAIVNKNTNMGIYGNMTTYTHMKLTSSHNEAANIQSNDATLVNENIARSLA